MKTNYLNQLKDIKAFIFDVDGVFTDGTVQITSSGELLRTMTVRDGYAVKQAVLKGYKMCIITGGNNKGVEIRLRSLGVETVHLGAEHKESIVGEFYKEHGLAQHEVAYMGDDLPDLEAIQLAGLKCCPQDAVPEIKAIADYISHKSGGKGCVRDIIEQVMRVQGHWPGQKK